MSLVTWISNLVAGPVLKLVSDMYGKHLDAGVDRNKLEADVKIEVLKMTASKVEKQKDVIVAEANSEDRLVRRWRPIVALGSFGVLFFYALILPIAVDWFGLPPVRVGDLVLEWMHNLTTIAIGGYIASRGVEKIAHTVMSKWR